MDTNLKIKDIDRMLDNSYNYDRVRRLAVNIFFCENLSNGISEKCKIVFNPYKYVNIEKDVDFFDEKYFHVAKFDEKLTSVQIDNYKKSFVFAFRHLYENNKLM